MALPAAPTQYPRHTEATRNPLERVMKRLWSTPAFVNAQRIRERRLLRRRQFTRKHRRPHVGPGQLDPRRVDRQLVAPEALDLFGEPDDTIKYVNDLRQALQTQGMRVFLDLTAVVTFTSVSLLVLRAIMDTRSRAPDTQVHGNLPVDPVVATEFKESGFLTGFAKTPPDLPPPQGLMLNKSDSTVYSRVAAELVDFASARIRITKECAYASSQNLVEVMTNTHNHARSERHKKRLSTRQNERWWASVYCRDNIAYFSFVDLGVGILNSVPAKSFWRRLQKSGATFSPGRSRLLKGAFEGRIGSATGIPGRGLGLPTMRKHAKEGRLAQLQVLTSDVFGSVVALDFRSARYPLRGTVFRWQNGQEGDRE